MCDNHQNITLRNIYDILSIIINESYQSLFPQYLIILLPLCDKNSWRKRQTFRRSTERMLIQNTVSKVESY